MEAANKLFKELKEFDSRVDELFSKTFEKPFSFVAKLAEDSGADLEDVEDCLSVAKDRDNEQELPLIEVRDGYSGKVTDMHVLEVHSRYLWAIKSDFSGIVREVMLSEVATAYFKLYLINESEEWK